MLGFLSKLLEFLMRNYFPKQPSSTPLHTLSKLYDVPVGFVAPSPSFEVVYCFICSRRRAAVARYRMNCLVLSHFHLTSVKFLNSEWGKVFNLHLFCVIFM